MKQRNITIDPLPDMDVQVEVKNKKDSDININCVLTINGKYVPITDMNLEQAECVLVVLEELSSKALAAGRRGTWDILYEVEQEFKRHIESLAKKCQVRIKLT